MKDEVNSLLESFLLQVRLVGYFLATPVGTYRSLGLFPTIRTLRLRKAMSRVLQVDHRRSAVVT